MAVPLSQNFSMLQNLVQQRRKIFSYALLKGSAKYPDLTGLVTFSSCRQGSCVDVEVTGLPEYRPAEGNRDPVGPFGFHVHEGGSCEPVHGEQPFSEAMGHYNPTNQPHGNHAGDFPVLFSNHGFAQMSFYTDRFTPGQVLGKTVVIHQNPDDYRTQPAGDSGERIACGVIVRY